MNSRYSFMLLWFASLPAAAALNVFACEPEWGALALELGRDKVSVYNATTAQQDPHRIEARPSLIARGRSADLVICTGAGLEAGWLPLLLSQSGNSKIQPGRPGYLEASSLVSRLEIPQQLDRAQGDIHAGGNPHVHLDPRNIARVAQELGNRLAQLDPANSAFYGESLQAFTDKWQGAIERWTQQASPLGKLPVIAHHRSFSYLFSWLGIDQLGTLEPKPGIEPTVAHLSELLELQKNRPARVIVRTVYEDSRASQWFAERARIPVVVLPFTVGGSDKAKDLFGLFDDTIAKLLAATG